MRKKQYDLCIGEGEVEVEKRGNPEVPSICQKETKKF